MTRSTPSISSSGNWTPASTTTMSSRVSNTVMLRPISPQPPRGMTRRYWPSRGGSGKGSFESRVLATGKNSCSIWAHSPPARYLPPRVSPGLQGPSQCGRLELCRAEHLDRARFAGRDRIHGVCEVDVSSSGVFDVRDEQAGERLVRLIAHSGVYDRAAEKIEYDRRRADLDIGEIHRRIESDEGRLRLGERQEIFQRRFAACERGDHRKPDNAAPDDALGRYGR